MGRACKLSLKQLQEKLEALEEALVEVEFEAEYKDYKKFREAVSIQLQNLKREKKIAQYHADETGKNVFYGLFEWLDDNGRPKCIYR